MNDPEVLLDRYELGELIGAGGSARVYRAHDHTLDREVAVKVLDSAAAQSADPASHARFLREARSSARFSHPNAVAVYDAGDDAGQLFIVMEYVDGGSLAERIAADAPIADQHVVRVGTQLLSALSAAHAVGLVHRDVKPANVLIDRAGTVKLADFGIARRFDEITSALTMEGMVIGTRAYLAPEQALGGDVGPAADLYAVGAVLFEMATGERPPMTAVGAERGADPRQIVPAIAPALAVAISTALAGRAEQRFGSAAEMTIGLTIATRRHAAAVAPPPARPAETAVMPAAPAPRTTVMTSAPRAVPGHRGAGHGGAGRSRAGRSGGRWWVVGVTALLVVGGLMTAFALTDANRSGADLVTQSTNVTSDTTNTDSTIASPATSPPATEAPATTMPPTTPPPTTAPPTTAPPTTVPIDELIPGFPATDDIEQFIEQLRAGDSPAGKQSKKLGDGLRDILKADDDRDKKVEDLVEKIAEWVEKDDLDPVVADRALEFLAEL